MFSHAAITLNLFNMIFSKRQNFGQIGEKYNWDNRDIYFLEELEYSVLGEVLPGTTGHGAKDLARLNDNKFV